MNKVNFFWFRRDLRLHDNCGLNHALSSGIPIVPIFIFDTNIIEQLPEDDARITLIYNKLKELNEELKNYNTSLLIKKGNPVTIFENLCKEYTIETIFSNEDYEPKAIDRDQKVTKSVSAYQVDFIQFKDQVIFAKNDILKNDGTPYTVYTPYSKKWIAKLKDKEISQYPSENLLTNLFKFSFQFPQLKDLGFIESTIGLRPVNLSEGLIANYQETRNIPSIKGTSNLSPLLRFGFISVRECVIEALKTSSKTFLKELIWREFFMQILYHFPDSEKHNFKRKYDAILWRNNEEEFKKWCNGKTGYPIVDAGMRELNQTGYMHNRVRMICASFLCKHLLIDWRWGEAYFALKLLDFDLAQNVGNWQWTAGT
ncbi:MAG: deoxyribodipyrimidine photo-lyase, partial [Flavobacteriaceae bacterium]|nr:deoxyribodipyrimidine photo-lyase [Flavobacteriaceae bacterium]